MDPGTGLDEAVEKKRLLVAVALWHARARKLRIVLSVTLCVPEMVRGENSENADDSEGERDE